MAIKKTKKQNKTLPLMFLVLAVLLAGIGYLVFHSNKNSTTLINPVAKTTSNLPTAQANYTSGTPRSPSSSNLSQGGATDDNGVINNTTTGNSDGTGGSGQSTSSTSGLITLENPSANETITSGIQIYGTAQVSTVQFQLIDNSVGVIAQGSLNVVNGSFSGALQFKSYSSTGQLNVFSQDSPTSPEVNIISIPVGFK